MKQRKIGLELSLIILCLLSILILLFFLNRNKIIDIPNYIFIGQIFVIILTPILYYLCAIRRQNCNSPYEIKKIRWIALGGVFFTTCILTSLFFLIYKDPTFLFIMLINLPFLIYAFVSVIRLNKDSK